LFAGYFLFLFSYSYGNLFSFSYYLVTKYNIAKQGTQKHSDAFPFEESLLGQQFRSRLSVKQSNLSKSYKHAG